MQSQGYPPVPRVFGGPGGHRAPRRAPEQLRKSRLSQGGRQPGCIRPVWGCRSGAQAGEAFGGSWEVGGWGWMGEGGARQHGELWEPECQGRLEASVG